MSVSTLSISIGAATPDQRFEFLHREISAALLKVLKNYLSKSRPGRANAPSPTDMAKFFEALGDSADRAFIEAQPVFFIASAVHEGRVNLCAEGAPVRSASSGRNLCAYLDITGSGNETAAQALGGGRATIMFCSFTRNPLVLRLYGRTPRGRAGRLALA